MTDKERLKMIKGIQKRIKECQEKGQNVSNLHSDYVDWLLNRVEELELELNDWRAEVHKWQQFYKESEESHLETKELLKSILNQNKCYREALESIRYMFPLRGGITYEKISKIRKTAEEALESDVE